MSSNTKAVLVLLLLLSPLIIHIAYNLCKGRYTAGRHHWGPSDIRRTGQVWFDDGTWWTFSRLGAHRVERLFGIRSNPLDYELRYETVPVPERTRRIYHEQEYPNA
ncbi:hypothetical protein [Mycolicibacterium sphagni]|uniref:hypothetical protein n=1 Tax=Mycolicibacterium sphagni TaxID=1786 RepID=UPI0021F37944|nr:hypothetical protein [Mycolicibacterium sphagni]MCV7175102.1 hypothetical protein [Mycolicibacterium sphagni]